jgi:outer membrane protein TolC
VKLSPISVLLVCALTGSAIPSRAEEPPPSSAPPLILNTALVERLLAEAQARHPAIKAGQARIDSAAAASEGVRTWEDPTFTVGLSLPTSRGFRSSEEGNLIYGIEQKLPTFNRPNLARAVAQADTAKEKLMLSYAVAQLRRDLSIALTQLAIDDAALELAGQDLDWLETTLDAVDHRYRVGKASQIDWLKIQTEKGRTLDRLRTLKLEREHRGVVLNRLLNRDLHAAWPLIELPREPVAIVYSEALAESVLQAEPKLLLMRQDVARAEATARMTRQQRKPEIGIGIQGRSYTGDAGFREGMVTMNFTMPWLNDRRYEQDYQRDRAKVRASELDATDYELALRENIHHLVTTLDAARRQVVLYQNELVPLTEQALSSASTAWANNLGTFQDVIDTRRLLVDDRLMLAQAFAEQTRTLAELSFLTGTNDLTAFYGPAQSPPAQPMGTMPGAPK